MRFRGRFVGILLSVTAGCSSFSGNSDTGGADADGGSALPDGGGPDAPPVPGSAGPFGLAMPGGVHVPQGGVAALKVSLTKLSSDSARIYVTGLPSGITAPDVTIHAPALDGDLQFKATAEIAQGAVAGLVIHAVSSDGVQASAPLDLFVRGKTGTLDTTYATGGVADLGASTYAHSKRYPNYVFVGTSNGGLRRFTRDGTPDNAFSLPINAAYQFSMAADESIFVYDQTNLAHYTKAGVADANFATVSIGSPGGGDGKAYMLLQIGPTATGGVVLAFDYILYSGASTQAVSSSGVKGTRTPIAVLNTNTSSAAFFTDAMEAQADGTFLLGIAGMDTSANALMNIIRLKSDASVDLTYGMNAISAGFIPGTQSRIWGLRRTNDGTYLLGSSTVGTYLMRRTNLGAYDMTFGDGTAASTTQIAASNTFPVFDIDSAGRAIVGYTASPASAASTLTLTRYTRKGVVDTTFGTNSSVTLDLGASAQVSGLHIVDDERALVVSTHDGDAFIQRIWL